MSTRYPIPALQEFVQTNAEEILNKIKHEKTLGNLVHVREFKEKNSLFLCTLAHCSTLENTKFFIESIKNLYSDATHNCWAFQIGKPQSTASIGCSDDGEPQGTAGKPMLNQLIHAPVGEIAAVVTRYFGGTKLGTGGLVRAYQFAVAYALENLPICEKTIPALLEITLDYSHGDILYRLLPQYEGEIKCTQRQADVTYTVQLPTDRTQEFTQALTTQTNGLLLLKELTLHTVEDSEIN